MSFSTKRVGDLIDDVYREWLEPPEDQAVLAILNAQIDVDATSLTYLDTYLSPEERYLLAPGSLIEINSELIRVGDADVDTNTLTDLKRGVDGTEASVHLSGSVIKIQPRYPRSTVFSLVRSSIAALWPPLYDVKNATVNAGTSYTEIPSDLIQPIQALWVADRYEPTQIRILPSFPPSSTGKAAFFPHLAPGQEVMLSYRSHPAIPSKERERLGDLGIRSNWERIIKVDVVLEAASNSDIERLGADFIGDRTELELNPILAASEIRQRLISYREYLVDRAVTQLDREFGAVLNVSNNWTFG